MTHPQTQDDEALVILAKRFALCHIDADNLAYESSGLTIDDWVETNWRDFLPEARSTMVALCKNDEALVEVMARAIFREHCWPVWGDHPDVESQIQQFWEQNGDDVDEAYRVARAALTALRNHEGRK